MRSWVPILLRRAHPPRERLPIGEREELAPGRGHMARLDILRRAT
ncbi:hypothetical protein BFJ63_vAg20421 [Fusarium oxysporum f. sp. narcissi]|uniref:Uncharacterized protein n=1 Tax=Fusarium oxysporum f. sp. narcissi TaxID=451672 RepID=A0A4Q2US03_FUSOX|nr:hypothetical protein BFJ63_vAg20421 [Fusarium oxysporum f. sp. narcissi]